MSAVEVRRIEPEPTHGRPRIAEFTSKRGGLHVHIERDTGGLWIFALGPSGGNRGALVLGVGRARDVARWEAEGCETILIGGRGYLRVYGEGDARLVSFGQTGSTGSPLRLPFPDEAWDEFRLCLREWASAVERVGPRP